ncbi:hypothetical protein DPM19_31330 [Actinomadura craniellae]|uniref:Uncharacterized protein n=1 Tax=Actinomadura craniellae TaxID=2231787 RepID=A0A365GWQ4_9ACTN|nr:hypothetical protein [Actinomadura craniellae]RAY11249.1 hypothetical protein DPM19_31330 [Actinomadura craniellae]
MTVILIILCLVITGRELYLVYDRKRPDPAVAELRARLAELDPDALGERVQRLEAAQTRHEEALEAADKRIGSLVSQINDRMLPEVNRQLDLHREDAEQARRDLDRTRHDTAARLARLEQSRTDLTDSFDALRETVARLRGRMLGQLDEAVGLALGAGPVDIVRGTLHGDAREPLESLGQAFEEWAEEFGLRRELRAWSTGKGPWQARYYLSGRSPRELERDFLDLLHTLRSGAAADLPAGAAATKSLILALNRLESGVVQCCPLVFARTPDALLCGVLPLAELGRPETGKLLTDPAAAAARLQDLPDTRCHDLSAWPRQVTAA